MRGVQDKPTHWLINSQKPNNSRRHQLTNSQTPQLQSPLTQISPTQKLISSRLISSKTPQLKNLNVIFYFTIPLKFSLRSSENMGHKVVKSLLFLVFRAFQYVQFKENDLHFVPFSLSRLVAKSLLFRPNYPLLAPKNPLFNHHFALFCDVFHGSKRFCLYHCGAYLFFSSCV